MKVLQVNSSIFGNGGQSSQLAGEFVAQLRERGATVTTRDLAADPIPHLDATRFGAFLAKPHERTPEQWAAAELSDRLIEEIRDADVLVIGAPMYNFGIPTQLKSWFDHVARAGVTFKYTEKGPVGLLGGRKAVVFSTRGGIHAGTPSDSETPHVRDFLALLGITDVEFIYAEGLALGEAPRAAALTGARRSLDRAVSTFAALPAAA